MLFWVQDRVKIGRYMLNVIVFSPGEFVYFQKLLNAPELRCVDMSILSFLKLFGVSVLRLFGVIYIKHIERNI